MQLKPAVLFGALLLAALDGRLDEGVELGTDEEATLDRGAELDATLERGTELDATLERGAELEATLERGAELTLERLDDVAAVELVPPPPICTSIQPWKRS